MPSILYKFAYDRLIRYMEKNIVIDSDFKRWVQDLKVQIRQAQIKAAVKVNSELLHLYWSLGGEITLRYESATYGSAFFHTLSRELLSEFPNMKGFSATNLKYVRRWYMFYNQDNVNRPQLVDDLGIFFFQYHGGIMAQYALEGSSQPIGISEYQLSTLIPDDFKSQLPSIEEIEASLREENK